MKKLQSVDITRTGSGRFSLVINGIVQESQNQFESTAIRAAINHLIANPNDTVKLVQNLEIRIDGTFIETEQLRTGFVRAKDGAFYLDGEPYYFGSTNAYYLATYESQDPAVVDRNLDFFVQSGCRVIRTWGFYDGQPMYENDPTFQPAPGVYNEEGLQCLDRAIAKGKNRGLKFIIPFVNNWEQLGGLPKYHEWLGIEGRNDLLQSDDFIHLFTGYIGMLLNRVNTETGIAYKDEPAIHSWQVANELRNTGAAATVVRDFYQKIAQFIKSIDTNHLVGTGEEGYDDASLGRWSVEGDFIHPNYQSNAYVNNYVLRAGVGSSYVLNTAIPEIDYGNFHWYPANMGFTNYPTDSAEFQDAQAAWMEDHNAIASLKSKPVILGEYGLDNAPLSEPERYNILSEMYLSLWDKAQDLGVNTHLWQLISGSTKAREFNGNISAGEGSREDDQLYSDFKDHVAAMSQL